MSETHRNRSFQIGREAEITIIALAPASRALAIGDEAGCVSVFLNSESAVRVLQAPSQLNWVHKLAWINDKVFLSAASDGVVTRFNLDTKIKVRFRSPSRVTGLARWNDDSCLILTASHGLYVWQLSQAAPFLLIQLRETADGLICNSGLGIIGINSELEMKVYRYETTEMIDNFGASLDAKFSPDGRELAILNMEGDITLYECTDLPVAWSRTLVVKSGMIAIRWLGSGRVLLGVDGVGKHHLIKQDGRDIEYLLRGLDSAKLWDSSATSIAIVTKARASGYQEVIELTSEKVVHRRNKDMKKTAVLHISDLHFKSTIDASKASLRLSEVIHKDKKDIDYLVISGDVSHQGNVDGYRGAVEFVRSLAKDLKIRPEQFSAKILVVPGNHDIDYVESGKSFQYVRLEDRHKQEWEEMVEKHGVLQLLQPQYDIRRLERFNREFYIPLFGSSYPLDGDDQVVTINSGDDELLIIGLNSAYRVDHINPKRARINPTALHKGLVRFNMFRENKLRAQAIVVVHHAVGQGSGQVPGKDLDLVSGGEILCILRGDSHEFGLNPGCRVISSLPPVLGAGFGGVTSEQIEGGVPWVFNYIEVDWSTGKSKAIARMKHTENGEWVPYPRFRDEAGVSTDEVTLSSR